MWLDLSNPSNETIAELRSGLGLSEGGTGDLLSREQQPKVDVHVDGELVVLVRSARLHEGHVRLGQITTIVGADFVITARHGDAADEHFISPLLATFADAAVETGDQLLYLLLEHVADSHADLVVRMEEDALAMETRILDDGLSSVDVRQVFSRRRSLMRMARMLRPTRDLVDHMARNEMPCLSPASQLPLMDVAMRLKHSEIAVRDLHSILGTIFEYSQLIEQQRSGATSRQLAAWAAILAVPQSSPACTA